MPLKIETHWISEPLRIGKHDWRIGVGSFRMMFNRLERCTFYQWRGPQSHVWNDGLHWPTYDTNDTYCGMPKTLTKLYERELATVKAMLHPETYRTELTPAGEQLCIPGTERQPVAGEPAQLSLFGG